MRKLRRTGFRKAVEVDAEQALQTQPLQVERDAEAAICLRLGMNMRPS